MNSGKPYAESFFDLDCSIACFEYYAGWTDKIFGKTIPVDGDFFCFTKHEPIGVCAQIIPWNYPIMMLAWKFGPALACGNTLVLKPAEQTPLSALVIAELAKEAGFPAGVINIVNGNLDSNQIIDLKVIWFYEYNNKYNYLGRGANTGALLSEHLDVNKIAFTGSVVVGRKIQEASAKSNLKRVTLELGGKSPFIITDVDDELIERAAEDTAASIFANQGKCFDIFEKLKKCSKKWWFRFSLWFSQGQSCCACSRIFVHEKVHDKYVSALAKIADSKVVGDPFDASTTNGAIISKVQFDKILDYIESGKKEGATVAAGGKKCGNNKGYFLRPTVFTNVTDDMKIAKEEIFGPVVCVFKWKTVDEVIKRAK